MDEKKNDLEIESIDELIPEDDELNQNTLEEVNVESNIGDDSVKETVEEFDSDSEVPVDTSSANSESKDDIEGIRHHTLLDPNPEILRYTTNKMSFWFVILAIVFNCLAFLDYYGKKGVTPDIFLGLDVIINILVLLACFVTAEEVKAYKEVFAYVAFGLAVVQIARIFFIPLKYSKVLINSYGTSYVYIIILYILSAIALVFGGIVCVLRSRILKNYLFSKESNEVK